MSKIAASDSKWAGLTEEQRDTLEGWLFEENITYREALERAEKEFGITASIASIARLYQKMADERLETELTGYDGDDKISDLLGGSPTLDVENLNHAAAMLMANRLVQIARRKPNKVKEMVSLARALATCQAIELKRDWLALEQRKQIMEIKRQEQAAADSA